MMKFVKNFEDENKIVYEIIPKEFYGTVEYLKRSNEVLFFDIDGKEYKSTVNRLAFSYVINANFPEEYLYATN